MYCFNNFKPLHPFLFGVLGLFWLSPHIASAKSCCDEGPDGCKRLLDRTANSLIGSRYAYGSSGQKGFDCSGFVLTLCQSLLGKQVALPRSSQAMFSAIPDSVNLENAKKGDLLFFRTGRGISHVAMYWGKDKNGRDLMCHASSSRGVEFRAFRNDGYWAPRLAGIKRIPTLFKTLHGSENGGDSKANLSSTAQGD